MKNILLLLFFIGFSFVKSQNTYEEIIQNDHKEYIGDINKKAKIKVVFDSVSLEKKDLEIYKVSGNSDVEGSKAKFSGTINFNDKKTKELNNSSFRVYDFRFFEDGTGKHNGVFSGNMIFKILSEKIIIIGFEGFWENYEKSLKFPVYFDNTNVILKNNS